MKSAKLLTVLIFISAIFCCTEKPTEAVVPQIIPLPLHQEIYEGEFILSSKTQLIGDSSFKVSLDFLKDYLSALNLNISEDAATSNVIQFIKDESINNIEGYTLDISKEAIKISAKTDQGAFYAVQTLRQLLPIAFENQKAEKKQYAVQCLKIEDAPAFHYRGMHLDVGRHFFSTHFIKKYIDALAMLKMNTFHWHLTEDQGWRIEIKKYPKLNEIAAFRNETLVGHYSDQPHQFDGKKYGGFYTQEEVKNIVKYAQARHVTVIPEIEMPGHSQAAIAAYPHLGCSGEQVEVATKWGVFEEIYCTKDETFNFIEDVLDEVAALFPSKYIHIGGDEAPKIRWETCDKCQNRIKTEGLKDEHELQSYFISRVVKYLNAKGKQIIGWDEILEGGLAPNATVMSWRGFEGAIQAAQEKHDVVMTPTSHCYFDYYQSTNENEKTAFGGFLPLEKVYNFNPIPKELSTEEAQYIIGAQGNVWTEYMPTEKRVEYMVFPRIMAMSEVVWSVNDNKNYVNFVTRVTNFNKRLEALDINYANHLYEVEGELISTKNESNFTLKTLITDQTIRYTLDGTEPYLSSELYKSNIPIKETVTIKAAVFDTEKKLGSTFVQTINVHKAVGKKITINKSPHKAYSGSGANGLINGVNGSNKRFGDKEWLGFWGEDIEIYIDFDKLVKINSIKTRFHNGNGQWIYAPKEVNLKLVLLDGTTVTDKVTLKNDSDSIITNYNFEFITPNGMDVKVKKMTLIIPNYGIIQEGKQGAGQKAWTFIDEIIVN